MPVGEGEVFSVRSNDCHPSLFDTNAVSPTSLTDHGRRDVDTRDVTSVGSSGSSGDRDAGAATDVENGIVGFYFEEVDHPVIRLFGQPGHHVPRQPSNEPVGRGKPASIHAPSLVLSHGVVPPRS